MAKQTELKNLLQELEIATCAHERVRATPFQANQQVRAYHAANKAEKRVFSFFDKLSAELQDSAAAYKNLQEQRNYLVQERDEARKAAVQWQNAAQAAKAALQELAQQVMAMKGQEPTVPPGNEPFNDARARAGDPIEFQPRYGAVWQDCRYVGMRSTGDVVIEVGESCLSHPVALVRMKSKAPQSLQMFANLYGRQGSSGQVGALYDTKEDADRMGSVTLLAVGVPVTITVVK